MLVDLDAPVRQFKEKWTERWLNCKQNRDYPECGKSSTACKCPKCGEDHRAFLQWTGRGVPRIFCADCRPLVAGIDDLENQCSGGGMARGSRKKPENFFE